MNAFGELVGSLTGWSEIIAGKADAGRHFALTRSGLTVAVLWFVGAVLLSLAVQSAAVGLPPTGQVIASIVAEMITLAVIGLGIRQSLGWLRPGVSTETLLVPVTYALAYMFVLAIPLQLLSAVLGLLLVLLVALMIARAAQVLAGLKIGPALALAGVCFLVLVVVPYALYILLLLIPSA